MIEMPFRGVGTKGKGSCVVHGVIVRVMRDLMYAEVNAFVHMV